MYVNSHNYAKINVTSYDSLPLKKLTFLNVTMHIKSIWNKDQNCCYYNLMMLIIVTLAKVKL